VQAQTQPQFKLGFKALADQVPDVVGQPLENEHWGDNGDSLQQTSNGLMAWRKADNWTAFTNGSRTWINGPAGVQDRPNDERFSWEAPTTPINPPAAPASPGPVASPPQGGQGIAGVWMGSYVPYGQYSPQERYLAMYEDETFFHDMPLEGFQGFDRQASQGSPNGQDSWGKYTFNGTSGTWKYNRTTTAPATEMSLTGNGDLKIGGDTYYRCTSVDGLRLNGAWTTYGDPRDPNLHGGGVQPIIRFAPDGRFRDEGVFDSGFKAITLGDDPQTVAPGAGSYEIKDFALTLRYDDGHVRKTAFSLLYKGASQPSPDVIFMYRTRMNRMP